MQNPSDLPTSDRRWPRLKEGRLDDSQQQQASPCRKCVAKGGDHPIHPSIPSRRSWMVGDPPPSTQLPHTATLIRGFPKTARVFFDLFIFFVFFFFSHAQPSDYLCVFSSLTNQHCTFVGQLLPKRLLVSITIRDIVVVAKRKCGILSRADVKRYPASKGQSCSEDGLGGPPPPPAWINQDAAAEGSLSLPTSDCRTAFHARHSQCKKAKKKNT
jgi:hypothetical protein